MKATLILAVFLLATFQTVSADTKLSDETCKELSTSSSVEAFSRDRNTELVKAYKLDEGPDSVNFFYEVTIRLKKSYDQLCKSKKDNVTIQEFREKQIKTCGDQCFQVSEEVFKNPMFGSNPKLKNADSVCHALCLKDYDKLNHVALGIDIGKNSKASAAGDCTGVVSDKGREIDVKSIEVDLDTRKTTIKTKAK
jgi:hypothetical protein